jgi:hypothetical protein
MTVAKMKHAVLPVLVALTCAAPACAQQRQIAQMKCDTGPALKTYGGTKWTVYSCADGASVIVIAAPGNPATPFIFRFAHDSSGYDLTGEGSGDRKYTDPAYAQLQKFDGATIRTLIEETKKAPKGHP